ncbi:MAG: GTP-binding protein [Bilifractor sp.]|nr:GTPase [Lachnospiraceae bacterium]MDY2837341.1 GTP-binding protein [Bilifractor sp.]
MDENEIEVPIYLITGFLESGKTSFLNFTIAQDYFQIDGPTLLINTEEGEEEYDEKELLKYNTVIETIDEQEQFSYENLRSFQRKYSPERVIIEFNPLWSVDKLWKMRFPRGWGIVQQIVTVDASTFQVYQTNMKSLFAEMSRQADMVLFNRCTKDMPLSNFRRSFKIVNPGCDVQFLDVDGQPVDIFEDSVPYDLDQDIIDIDDVDYGIFFVDLQDNPDRYKGKKVRFKGMVLKSREAGADFFMPARTAMTCCAADMQYIGYLCHSKNAAKLTEGSWVQLTARVDYKFVPMAQEEEPVFQAITIKAAEPPAVETVYFN